MVQLLAVWPPLQIQAIELLTEIRKQDDEVTPAAVAILTRMAEIADVEECKGLADEQAATVAAYWAEERKWGN